MQHEESCATVQLRQLRLIVLLHICLAAQLEDERQEERVVVLLGKVPAPLQERCPFPLFQNF